MVRRIAAVAALAAGVAAQQLPDIPAGYEPNAYLAFDYTSSTTASSVSYTTITFEDCPTAAPETMITVLQGTTVTYCPMCDTQPTAKPAGHTTVYTTTYMSLCPTGTVPATFTITESCEEETPTWTPGPSHVPQGFTVTVKDCHACEGGNSKTPVPVTITEPCDCEATHGTSIGPKPTAPAPKPAGNPVTQISDGQVQAPTGNPVQQISDGQVQNPTGKPVTQIGDGQVQAPAPPAAGAGKKPAAPAATYPKPPPYPTMASIATPACPGPNCRVPMATGGGGVAMPTGVIPTTPNTPAGGSSPAPAGDGAAAAAEASPAAYQGGAGSVSAAYGFSLGAAVVVGGLAFAL